MRALRTRLLVVFATAVIAMYGIWFAGQYVQLTQQQSARWDASLRYIGARMLLSMPDNIDEISSRGRLRPADGIDPKASRFWSGHFQLWLPATGRHLLSSPGAPHMPMNPTFEEGFADVTIDDSPWRIYSMNDATGRVQVQAGHDRSRMRAEMLDWFYRSLVSTALVLIILAIASWVVIRWSLKPVVSAAEAIGRRPPLDLSPLPERELPKEFLPLVGAFNTLLARLDVTLQREREFFGEAAHELRTPLAALLAQAQVAQHATDPEQSSRALEHLVSGIERASRLAQQLLDAARLDASRTSSEWIRIDLAHVAGMVAEEFRIVAAQRAQQVRLDLAPAPVLGNLDELGILVRNLLDNALRYGRDGGCVRLRVWAGPAARAHLVVEDDGPGIPRVDRERVFQRFYRGAQGAGQRGSGIGLSLVGRVIAAHGGTYACQDGLGGRGFGIRIDLPLAAAAHPVRGDAPYPWHASDTGGA